ncbi:hypothetical protein [Algibacter mikhailovii]|uniref:hypothetical protein n=1 Tax=Algibacter mikhailovii TaxID=425498 RepID=UPI0024948546|nr:hypothetical protein [Algibacter mikhailovii]
MTKQEIRAQIAMAFLQGLRNVMSEDPTTKVINVQVCLDEQPDYSKTSSFKLNVITKISGL